ncbi:MAG TPA: hypothetical protein VMG10_17795 [Gemmataceae bacterium]|nr:hypothetical protein [Gemmataceae bacterium]
MSLASWIHVPRSHRTLALNKASRRQRRRWPAHSRPALEYLEERALLDGSGAIPGADALGSNFAPVSIGLGLPLGANFPSTTGVTTQTYPSADAGVAEAATSAFVTQNLASGQFRDFAVNSEGETDSLFQTTTNILLDAYGFGSGTQPNRPWAPAAYNLGLANNQFGYPSQSDLGFSATPPWFRPTAKALPEEQLLDRDEEADLTPDSSLIHEKPKKREQDQQRWTKAEDTRDQSTEKAATEEKEATEEQKIQEGQTLPEETAPKPTRGDPAVEGVLFNDPLQTLAAAAQANGLDPATPRLANAKHSLAGKENKVEGPAAEDSRIPSSLWISALAPAQMAALVAGMPGVGAPANAGNLGSVAAAAE